MHLIMIDTIITVTITMLHPWMHLYLQMQVHYQVIHHGLVAHAKTVLLLANQQMKIGGARTNSANSLILDISNFKLHS